MFFLNDQNVITQVNHKKFHGQVWHLKMRNMMITVYTVWKDFRV